MAVVKTIVWGNEPVRLTADTVRLLGGKSVGLHELRQNGMCVPDWATLSTEFFANLAHTDRELVRLLGGGSADPAGKAAQVRAYVRQIAWEGTNLQVLHKVWRAISRHGSRPLAVRSSAADEDSAALSFAGQMDSFLNVRGFAAFEQAVRDCWASLFNERAVLYRMQHGIDPWQARIAVIVQQMVESEAAGVVFTANPLTGNPAQMLISSTWGLGEGLVSGKMEADTFTLNAAGDIVAQEIAEKQQAIRYGPAGATITVDIPPPLRNQPSLSARQLRQVFRLADRARRYKKIPLDIEFAVARRQVYLLQARPITNLKTYEELQVWDNSNIVESYSGVTTPLTFSFIRQAYFAVYWQFCQTIGVDKKTIAAHAPVFENMLGLICGRVYYNLLNWYRLVSLMPGFRYNRRFMEQMMGLQVVKDFDIGAAPSGIFEKYCVQLPRLLKVGAQMIIAHRRLPKNIAAFHVQFAKIYAQYAPEDFNRFSPPELLAIYRRLEKEVLWKWKAPITNDFEAMIFYGLLKNLTMKWEIDPQGVLQNDLLCGEGGIKSTQVTTQLFYLAKEIEQRPDLKAVFLQGSPEEALASLNEDAAFGVIKEKFRAYLDEYGVRCINEMKLESMPLKDDPLFCIAMLQNYLRTTVPDPEQQQAHERNIRAQAEATLRLKLAGQRFGGIFSRLRFYQWVLRQARQAIKNRENQRFCRTQAYSLVRMIMRALGRQWQQHGLIAQAEDIFYLEIDEVWAEAEGKSPRLDLKALIKQRREEFARYGQLSLPDHIESYGPVNLEALRADESAAPADGILRGLGCCAGVVEKEVRVVRTPDLNLRLNGEIMAAPQTDPGWVVLFPSISGLIVEKGSMLSHSAIVAREMGIPAVVGVKQATQVLASGDRVVLNGAEGTIKIVEKSSCGEKIHII
ncbi:MAG: PEP-utilizing enzyme [Candidatus Omnitrophica bacterium]|nr:PEP-utilizing enzyme [Candidatus Omnitrophota bacterium]